MATPVALNPNDAPSWWDFITKFDATFASFNENYSALQQLGPYIQNNHPELLSQYNSMMQQGATNDATLQKLKATRDYVYSWLQWLETGAGNIASFVSSTAQSTYSWALQQMGLGGIEEGLGFIPVAMAVIGTAAGIAALVVIAKWITDAYTFAQRLNALQAQEAQGLTPAQASQIVNQTLGAPSSGGFLGIPWVLIAWAAIAVVIGPPVIKAITDARVRT